MGRGSRTTRRAIKRPTRTGATPWPERPQKSLFQRESSTRVSSPARFSDLDAPPAERQTERNLTQIPGRFSKRARFARTRRRRKKRKRKRNKTHAVRGADGEEAAGLARCLGVLEPVATDSLSVTRSFLVRFGRSIVQEYSHVSCGSSEHHRSSSPETISPTLKHQRDSEEQQDRPECCCHHKETLSKFRFSRVNFLSLSLSLSLARARARGRSGMAGSSVSATWKARSTSSRRSVTREMRMQ